MSISCTLNLKLYSAVLNLCSAVLNLYSTVLNLSSALRNITFFVDYKHLHTVKRLIFPSEIKKSIRSFILPQPGEESSMHPGNP